MTSEDAMTNTLVPPPPPEDEDTDAAALVERMTAEIGGVLESLDELSDYLERVVHAVRREVTGCDEVGITILSNDRPHSAAYTTVQTLEIDAAQYALGEGPCLDAARTREEQRVDDLCQDDGRWPRFAEVSRSDGMRSLFAVPLISGEECVGALNLYAWAHAAFDGFDAAVVRVAARRCADAVVAVTALDGMRQLAGQLEQAMASRAVIEQAKGVIMAMRGIPEHDAFEVLRKTSQDRNVKVRVLAEEVVHGIVTGSTGLDPSGE
ncbi:GAF and ANTAR domain-containing protein [Phycicoccus endophyticus]|uniref:GAF and ANTAR domain-containing protein n=1 Tax=Phycicoccus endophyticus TaxID=1690220 RepID=A0A7G9R147_9MICO|nr:GAF and ANTAR domain-containing protein [Phycicoccus endophyticus]NHI20548.1 GAF and ANTAR domain-containing protein [Phycicoccus endophyticus]QNN49322.1 GAF and ANTAR domain-containing protein [Phycicoccus endophyticus]